MMSEQSSRELLELSSHCWLKVTSTVPLAMIKALQNEPARNGIHARS